MKVYTYDDGSVRERAFAEDLDDLKRMLRDEVGYDIDEPGYMEHWREESPETLIRVRMDKSDEADPEGDGVRYTDDARSAEDWIKAEGHRAHIFASTEF